MNASLDTPVLLLIFNRPEATGEVFDRIRQARPRQLFIASDGPRDHVETDVEKIAACHDIVSRVDWPCTVETLYREKNLGSRIALRDAMTWFFEHVEHGIILEDDCVPTPEFFGFSESMLQRYADSEGVAMISGTNYMVDAPIPGESGASYFFSRYCHVWGWATWANRWQDFIANGPGSRYDAAELKMALDNAGLKRLFPRWYWRRIFARRVLREIPNWDFRWMMHCWKRHQLCIIPRVNMVSNIGHGPGATRTLWASRRIAALPTKSLAVPYSEPSTTGVNELYDRYYERNIVFLEYVLVDGHRKIRHWVTKQWNRVVSAFTH